MYGAITLSRYVKEAMGALPAPIRGNYDRTLHLRPMSTYGDYALVELQKIPRSIGCEYAYSTTYTLNLSTQTVILFESFEMPVYKHDGPVDCPAAFDTSNVSGKLAIVTGGKMSFLRPSLLHSFMLMFIKAQMGSGRHMSELFNPLGELFVLFVLDF